MMLSVPPSLWRLTIRRHSSLLADSCQLTANSLQLTADSFYLLTAFPTTVIDSSLALRMTPFVLRHYDAFRSPLLVTCFPQIVILNGGKNAVQEKRETGQWHRVKNLWFWWHLTAFLTTGTEHSHSLRMTFNVFLTTTANPLLLFRMTPNGNHMLRLLTHS